MTICDFGITAALTVAGGAMSYAGLVVPNGFEALHFVSAVAMASGYVVGRDYLKSRSLWFIIPGTGISVISVIGYYISINYLPAGICLVVLLAVLAFLSFWPISYILAIAHNRPTA